jgi:hypothetical protein
MPFYGNNRRQEVEVEKNTKFTRFSIFFALHIICLVFSIEGLKINFRYAFEQNFTALLLEKEFILEELKNRN